MKQRIFCVDDTIEVRNAIRSIVEEFGHDFLGGASSLEELSFWLQTNEAKNITIAIINLSLRSGLVGGSPDESGVEGLETLRKDGFRGGVVWTTSFSLEDFSEEIRRTEFPVLQKPFTLENLEVALFKAALSPR